MLDEVVEIAGILAMRSDHETVVSTSEDADAAFHQCLNAGDGAVEFLPEPHRLNLLLGEPIVPLIGGDRCETDVWADEQPVFVGLEQIECLLVGVIGVVYYLDAMPDTEFDRLRAAGVRAESFAVGVRHLGGGGDLGLAHDGRLRAGVRHE